MTHTSLDIPSLASEIDARLRGLPNHVTATVRGLRREFSKLIAKAPARDVVALALRVMEGGTFHHRFVAYELVNNHRAALASLTAGDLEKFGRGLDSWESVDTFGCYLAGPAWRELQVPDSLIEKWTRSKDRWRRRSALVSTVPLNNRARGGRGDAERTLHICAMLIGDRDDMVVKAMSWALRELAKRDSAAVRAFIAEHEPRLAARVLREVRTKLETGRKNPRQT